MNMIQIDRLSRQTQHKQQTISRLQTQIQCLKNDLQTQKQLTIRIQSQNQQLRKQIELLKRKQQQQQYQKQQTQSRYLLVLQKLEQQVEEGKKKFLKLNNKIAPLVDYDSVRLSIMNQLSQQYEIQTERYKHTIDVQKQQIHKLKRQKTLVEHKLETLKIDYEDRIRKMNNSIKNQSSQNQMTVLSLEMSKEIQNRLKLSYQTVRKQAEYYKDKYFTAEKKYQEKIVALQRELKEIKSNM